MSTSSNRSIPARKADHVRICADEKSYRIESEQDDFKQVHFVPNALPELNFANISTAIDFHNYKLTLPLMISPMSGGTKVRRDFNQLVATIAQQARVACGLGSMRVLFRHHEMESQFAIKKIARDVPVIANIGSVQLRDYPIDTTLKLCDRLQIDALSVHLNCGQELFQEDGDRDFIGARAAIAELVSKSPCPIIVKETGFGIAPREVRALIECGVQYVDVAGAGGANWIKVEAYRHEGITARYPSANLFSDWGLSTAVILAALRDSDLVQNCSIIASGGIRNAMHIAKSIALGASLASMALPFVRLIINHGAEQAIEFIEQLKLDLATIMLLCGAGDIAALRKSAVILGSDIAHRAHQLREPTA